MKQLCTSTDSQRRSPEAKSDTDPLIPFSHCAALQPPFPSWQLNWWSRYKNILKKNQDNLEGISYDRSPEILKDLKKNVVHQTRQPKIIITQSSIHHPDQSHLTRALHTLQAENNVSSLLNTFHNNTELRKYSLSEKRSRSHLRTVTGKLQIDACRSTHFLVPGKQEIPQHITSSTQHLQPLLAVKKCLFL